jgi:uncharacterized protein YdcH (DUF465 family)
MMTPEALLELRRNLQILIDEHAALKARVAAYQQRRWLGPGEEMELRTLQRLKLRRKDQMVELQQQLSAEESSTHAVVR